MKKQENNGNNIGLDPKYNIKEWFLKPLFLFFYYL